ncbi:hypothetical protein H310_06280 [Aphanomyces invadans]|uniref:Tyrosine specific protein phosphatases domain-containing protein n=1 Tax=Aphanomyces invadans TaxID=157072 RepID=A0A024U6Y3_9STRA|nr:hypothetical protein H310_06280 [Aphanomyces invadans]ETW01657.1 hypothetical protein H310_06280 [Aphanomyces invadans]|eukprot:XP_008869505.1 hypothetical protein H310_06280 [Aphanomyces invadans]
MGTATVADIVHEILEAESLPIPSSSLLALIQTLVDHAEHLEQTVSDLNEQLDNLREQVTLGNAATVIQAGFRGAKDREIIMRAKKFQQQGTRVLKKYLLKKDRVPGLHKLDTLHGDIAPNFRRLKGSPIYGGAQPSEDGIKHILDIVAADGYSKVVWVTLREEAVIFVEGTPFTARRSGKLNDNDLVPGMTGHNITVLESTLKNSLVDQLKSSDHRFEYWHEPTLLCNELAVTTVDPSHVLTLPELMSSIQHTRIRSITYYRAPIDRENFPEHSILDQLVEWIHNADATTAMIFNCQKGRGRTTTAMSLAYLIWSAPLEMQSFVSTHAHPEVRLVRAMTMDPRNVDYKLGLYKVILALCEKLEHGVRTKGWVDKVIDDASAIYNIRLVIDEYRTKSLEEAKPAKRSFFLHRACRLLERYFYFIVFGSYLTTTPTDVPFSTWLQGHPDLFRLLDTMGGATYPSSKVLHNNILKFDHFPGLNRLPMVLGPNVPNFRQVGDFPIFGTAQVFQEGIVDVLQHLRSIGHPKAIWINLREEVILYVAGRPFAVRNQDNVFLNAEYPGIEVNEITAIEATLKKELIEKVSRNNGLFKHLHEPREYVTEESFDVISPENDIFTLDDAYHAVRRAGFDVRYARIPVSDEIAPEEKDFDDLVRLLGPIFTSEVGSQHPTAIICNCQMGRGRTTTMLVCMYMLRAVIAGAVPSHVEPKSTVHFGVIDELVATLDNGQASLDLVNHAVDMADHVQNLRDCIDSCRELTKENGLSVEKQEYFMQRAVNYLERYFYLICFASYILDEQPKKFPTLFVNWMCSRYDNALYALLDNLNFDDKNDDVVSSMRWRWRRKRKLVYRLE